LSPRHANLRAVPKEVASPSLAAHEAGHAVAAVVLRLSLRYVTLRPRGPEDALTYTRTRRNESPDYLERQAVCDLAGIAAEQLLNGRVIVGSATGDIPHARGIAERLGVEAVQAFIDAKLREAEMIVSANRAGVEGRPSRPCRAANPQGNRGPSAPFGYISEHSRTQAGLSLELSRPL
jgi:hypothetical protein